MFSWAITEIVRYSFYALTLINAVPYALKYLRYSLFLVLYPTGISSELVCTVYAFISFRCVCDS